MVRDVRSTGSEEERERDQLRDVVVVISEQIKHNDSDHTTSVLAEKKEGGWW